MYEKMLIPVDGSEISSKAAHDGMELAGLTGSSVTLLYVVDTAILSIPDAEVGIANAEALRESFRAQGDSVLKELDSYASGKGIQVETLLAEGDVHNEIVSVAGRIKAGIIVMGTHGRRGLNRMILGSVAESVARRAHCAVLLIRPEPSE